MTQKITHIIEKDRHGHVKHDVPITVPITSEEGDSELLAMSQKGASDIAASTRDKITDLVVVDRDGTPHSKTHTDPDTGEKVAVLQADEIGKIDGVKVNGEELPVDDNGKVDITIPQSVHDLDPDDAYATKADAQAMVDEAKVTGATLDYQEDGGTPSATVDFSEGSLGFTLKNMKMKFSDLAPDEIAAITGPQGIPGEGAIWTGSGEEIMTLEQETGNSIGKAMSQKAVTDGITTYKEIDLTDEKSVDIVNGKRLNNATSGDNVGAWVSATGHQCLLVPVISGRCVEINFKSGTYYAFLSADGGKTSKVTFADGYSYPVTSNGTIFVEVPSDAKQLYIMTNNNGEADLTPYSVRFATHIKDKTAELDNKYDAILLEEINEFTEDDYSILSTGKYGQSTTYKHARIPVKEGEQYIVSSYNYKGALYAFVTSYDVVAGGNIPVVDGYGIEQVRRTKEAILTVPKGANYLIVYNEGNARPFMVKKVKSSVSESKRTITPKMMFEVILGTTGENYFNPSDTGSINTISHGRMCATPRFIKTCKGFRLTLSYEYLYARIFYYDDNFNYIGYTQYYRSSAGQTIDIDPALSFSYIKIVVRSGDDTDFVLASVKLTGYFADDWDTYNPMPSDEGYKRVSVLVNVTNQNCTNEDSQTIQDQADYHLDNGLLALPPTYTNDGNPTRLIIYCHGSGAHFNLSSTRFDINTHVDPTYWLKNGYAVMDMDGYHLDDTTAHAFAPQAMDCYVAGYKWVIEHYNIKRDGVFLGGRSMGGGNTLSLLRLQCPIPVIGACANLPTSLAMNGSKAAKQNMANSRGFVIPDGFEWSNGTNETPYNTSDIEVILSNWNKFITWWSITSLIIDFPTDETWRRNFIASCGLNNTERINLMKGLHAIAKAPLKIFGCWQDPNNTPETASILYNQILSNSGQIAELRMCNSYKDYSGTVYTAHYYELQDPALRDDVTTIMGEDVENVPIIYVEMLQFWKRYEQE